MRDYIIALAMTALITAVLEIFAPKEYEKYIKLAAGVLMMSAIVYPVAKLGDVRLSEKISSYAVEEDLLLNNITDELEKRVEQDIEIRIENEFGIESSVDVKLELDENHKIAGVDEIRIKSSQNPDKMQERLEEVYGCSKVRIELK